MHADRTRVVRAIHEARRRLGRVRGTIDDEAIRVAIASACDTTGIAPQQYAVALAEDPSLVKLEHDAIDDAIAGAPDPGPYAAVSRESMSGKPGDTTKSRTHPEPPPRPR